MCKCLLRRRSTSSSSSSSSSFQKSVFSFFSSVNAMRRRVQRKRFNNPKRRARVKTSNKKRVCRDARVISEKLLEQKIFFFLALTERRICKNVIKVCLCGRERRVGASLSFTCVCVCIFRRYNEKKGIREGTFSLCVSLSLSSSFRSSAALCAFFFFRFILILVLCASSFVLSLSRLCLSRLFPRVTAV